MHVMFAKKKNHTLNMSHCHSVICATTERWLCYCCIVGCIWCTTCMLMCGAYVKHTQVQYYMYI